MKRNVRRYGYAAAVVLALFVCLMAGMQARAAGSGYKIAVNRAANCVTVYERTADGGLGAPVRSFICSVGRTGHATPLGEFKTSDYYEWRLMVDGSYGRYAIRFNKGIMFHSVPYYKKNPATLEWEQYNLLGEPASLGCVRLPFADIKWIYENCPRGTEVVVYDDAENPGPLGKPSEMKIPEGNPTWDPTNTEGENPWNSLRPTLYQKDGYADGVIRMPVGASPDYIYNVVGLMECNGYVCNPGEYKLTMYGNYDLNQAGLYDVSVIGAGVIGVRCEYRLPLWIGEFGPAAPALPMLPTVPGPLADPAVSTVPGTTADPAVPTVPTVPAVPGIPADPEDSGVSNRAG